MLNHRAAQDRVTGPLRHIGYSMPSILGIGHRAEWVLPGYTGAADE